MKKICLIFLIVFFLIEATYGQLKVDTTKHGLKTNIGLSTGILFSSFYKNPKADFPGTITYENKHTTGFSAGCFITLIFGKHFSFQPEIAYNRIHHNIKFQFMDSIQNVLNSQNIFYAGDYELNTSLLHLSLMPKFVVGKKFKPYIGIGPFFNIVLANDIKGQLKECGTMTSAQSANDSIGMFPVVVHYESVKNNKEIYQNVKNISGVTGVIGFTIPYKENNFGIELRGSVTTDEIIRFLHLKHSSFSINFVYQFVSSD